MAGFDAFISCSRRAAATLATDLQSAVERFAGSWYRLRAVRIFRDGASMAADPALPGDRVTAACAVAARDLTGDGRARCGLGPAPSDLRCVQ